MSRSEWVTDGSSMKPNPEGGPARQGLHPFSNGHVFFSDSEFMPNFPLQIFLSIHYISLHTVHIIYVYVYICISIYKYIYYIILYFIILYYIILYFYYIILHILYYIILILYYIILYYIILYIVEHACMHG